MKSVIKFYNEKANEIIGLIIFIMLIGLYHYHINYIKTYESYSEIPKPEYNGDEITQLNKYKLGMSSDEFEGIEYGEYRPHDTIHFCENYIYDISLNFRNGLLIDIFFKVKDSKHFDYLLTEKYGKPISCYTNWVGGDFNICNTGYSIGDKIYGYYSPRYSVLVGYTEKFLKEKSLEEKYKNCSL